MNNLIKFLWLMICIVFYGYVIRYFHLTDGLVWWEWISYVGTWIMLILHIVDMYGFVNRIEHK